jgi:hypothetical protein
MRCLLLVVVEASDVAPPLRIVLGDLRTRLARILTPCNVAVKAFLLLARRLIVRERPDRRGYGLARRDLRYALGEGGFWQLLLAS